MDDWKGEHLIRGQKPTTAERQSENGRIVTKTAKRTGRWGKSLAQRQAHGVFVGTCFGAIRRVREASE